MKVVHPIDPGDGPYAVAHLGPVRADQRDAVRTGWRARAGDFFVGILCDPPAGADVWNASQLQSLLHNAGRQVRVVVHDGGRHHAEGGRWARQLGLEWLLVRDPAMEEPWRVAAGLDAAMVVGARTKITPGVRAATAPVRWALAAGLPVLAERGGGAEQIINNGGAGALFEAGDVDAACQWIMSTCGEPPRSV